MLRLGVGASAEALNAAIDAIEQVVKTIPVGGDTFTCRTWLKEAVEQLSDAGYLECPSGEELELELKFLAARQENSPILPWPGHYVSQCSSSPSWVALT